MTVSASTLSPAQIARLMRVVEPIEQLTESVKLFRAAEKFHLKIQPFAPEAFPLRQLARELIYFRLQKRGIRRGKYAN